MQWSVFLIFLDEAVSTWKIDSTFTRFDLSTISQNSLTISDLYKIDQLFRCPIVTAIGHLLHSHSKTKFVSYLPSSKYPLFLS